VHSDTKELDVSSNARMYAISLAGAAKIRTNRKPESVGRMCETEADVASIPEERSAVLLRKLASDSGLGCIGLN
jgi:hypothetical protein